MQEVWKDIIGYEGIYQISRYGDVKSLTRPWVKTERIIKPYISKGGYLSIMLCDGKKRKTFHVHKLVMEAFVCKMPKGMQINHIDGNKKNNYVENLEWVTPSENIKHAYKNKMNSGPVGKKNRSTNLTRSDVLKIKSMILDNVECTKIAKVFNVTPNTIYLIKHNKTWKHVSI